MVDRGRPADADLRLADLIGADLRGADLRSADLADSLFLTQFQLNAARGKRRHQLPARPEPPAALGGNLTTTGWVLHFDLDQFIAAVEVLRRPELAGLPVVVGGAGDPSQRAVVATASYEARAFGVRSGMPLRVAARKCPDAVFLPHDRAVYEQASAQVMSILRDFAEIPTTVEVLGWDEAFLGATTDDPAGLARAAQAAVQDGTGLWSSVGIGDNVLRAKVATEFGKPRGFFTLTAGNWFEVMGDRPTESLWGIGRKTARRLADLGYATVSDLAAADPHELGRLVGPTMGPRYVGLARGQARTEVFGTPYVPRSRSRETTFQHDLDDWTEIRSEVDRLARQVTDDLRTDGRPAVRVGVKVRFQAVPHHDRERSTGPTDPRPRGGGRGRRPTARAVRPRPPDPLAGHPGRVRCGRPHDPRQPEPGQGRSRRGRRDMTGAVPAGRTRR